MPATTPLLTPADADIDIDLRDGQAEVSARVHDRDAEPPVVAVVAARPRWRRIVGLAGWVAVSAVIGLLFLPTALGYSRYAIMGGSMSPTYELGSAVFEKPVPVASLEVGDVITYVPPGSTGIDTYVTHRIVEITETDDGQPRFRTQGDANEAVDPWTFTLDRETQNVVRFSVPHLGTALTNLADPDVRQLVIGIPAGFIALGAVLELLGIGSLRQLVSRRR